MSTVNADTMILSTSSTRDKLEVVCEATGSPLTIILRLQQTATIQDGNIASPHAFKLHFEREDGTKVTITHIDDVWELLPTTRGRWVFQSITPLTPQQARLGHGPQSYAAAGPARPRAPVLRRSMFSK
jgi:hypothetical protein